MYFMSQASFRRWRFFIGMSGGGGGSFTWTWCALGFMWDSCAQNHCQISSNTAEYFWKLNVTKTNTIIQVCVHFMYLHNSFCSLQFSPMAWWWLLCAQTSSQKRIFENTARSDYRTNKNKCPLVITKPLITNKCKKRDLSSIVTHS
jgi:hypothetical protein